MLYNLKFSLLPALLFFALACNSNEKDTSSSEKSESVLHSQDFEGFYNKFHADSSFQLERISFPLEGNSYNEDGEVTTISWTKANWKVHKPFDDIGGTFQRSFSSFGDIVTEVICDQNKISSMERRFAQVQGEWHLIYYDPIHLHQ